MNTFRIVETEIPWMKAAGLRTLDDFMAQPVGERVSIDHNGRELRRLSVQADGASRVFFLKRIGREPGAKLVQMLLFGRWPCSGPIRELRMLQILQESGFPTMRQVAYGQKRILGWPVGGFLMVEEVQGREVGDLVNEGDSALLEKLFLDLGAYLGRLHRAGFFQVVRLKDLFCRPAETGTERSFEFVLIDRESSKPWKKRFSEKSCFHSLARAARRIQRDGYRLGHGQIRRFFQGYLDSCGVSLGNMSRGDFRKKVFSTLRKEFGRKLKSSGQGSRKKKG